MIATDRNCVLSVTPVKSISFVIEERGRIVRPQKAIRLASDECST